MLMIHHVHMQAERIGGPSAALENPASWSQRCITTGKPGKRPWDIGAAGSLELGFLTLMFSTDASI